MQSERLIDVGRILRERSPRLNRRLTPVGVALLRLAIHERELNRAARSTAELSPGEFAETVLARLGIRTTVLGIEHLRSAHRPIVCANHPSGAVEGLALIGALWKYAGSCRLPANDLLCLLAPLRRIIIPVRSFRLTRSGASGFSNALAGDDPVLVFPAGVTARERGRRLREAPWRSSFVTRARLARRDVLPVAVSGRNSRRFYAIHKTRQLLGIPLNVEMALLVDEMFRRRGDTIVVRFLAPRGAPPAGGRSDDRSLTDSIQRSVEAEAHRLNTVKGG